MHLKLLTLFFIIFTLVPQGAHAAEDSFAPKIQQLIRKNFPSIKQSKGTLTVKIAPGSHELPISSTARAKLVIPADTSAEVKIKLGQRGGLKGLDVKFSRTVTLENGVQTANELHRAFSGRGPGLLRAAAGILTEAKVEIDGLSLKMTGQGAQAVLVPQMKGSAAMLGARALINRNSILTGLAVPSIKPADLPRILKSLPASLLGAVKELATGAQGRFKTEASPAVLGLGPGAPVELTTDFAARLINGGTINVTRGDVKISGAKVNGTLSLTGELTISE